MIFEVHSGLHLPQLKHFEIHTLEIKSKLLKGNPLKDPFIRRHPVLRPKAASKKKEGLPVVFVLAGFTGNGPNYFGLKSFELNFPQVIDQSYHKKEAPEAVYVFIDAMTSIGGSQFLDSAAIGKYESHIIKEVIPALQADQTISRSSKNWAIMGGSSGGYGALQIGSKYPQHFSYLGAIAPDSFFEACYMKDIYRASPFLKELGGFAGIVKLVKNGKIKKTKAWHDVLGAVAMAACYSPSSSGKGIEYP